MEVFHTCYYINLERSKDRRGEMEKRFTNLKRVEGVDGMNLHISKEILSRCKMNVFQIGCLQSHLKAIKTAYDNGDKEALIMEDDICADYLKRWEKSIQQIVDNKPKDAECIQLHCSMKREVIKMLKMNTDYSLWKKCYVRNSTGCYYITRKGMKKIIKLGLDFIPNTFYPADHFIYDKIITYNYTKPLFNLKNRNTSLLGIINFRNNWDNKLFGKYFRKIRLIRRLKNNNKVRKKKINLNVNRLKKVKKMEVKRRIKIRLRNIMIGLKKNNKLLNRIIS